jgi:hypothetical protein
MLVTVIAAATFAGSPQVFSSPEETDTKGYALVFGDKQEEGFELFFKDSGKAWSDVPEAQAAADQKRDNSWLVFHLGNVNADFFVRIALQASKVPIADGRAAADFRGYFHTTDPAAPEAMNNFGLHDIY